VTRAGRAIGWEFGRHYRFGLVAFGLYIAAFMALWSLLVGPGVRLRFAPPDGLASFIIAPATFAFFFAVGVFTYGLAGDLGARESIMPKRLFTLPVSTAALAGWPMFYGITAAAALWIATLLLARWAGGGDVGLPHVWPGFMLASWLAWMQALMWMPYGLRNLRVVVAVAWLMMIDAVVLIAAYSGAGEGVMVAMLAPQLPVAYLVALYAVGRARHGHVPQWSLPFASAASRARGREDRFGSTAHAQAWFEWRRHGWTLPMLVSFVVPAELLLLFIPGNSTRGIVFAILFFVAITPPLMALLAAPALSAPTLHAATRPMTSVALVAAKMRMTAWSAITAWALVLAFTAAALVLSGTLPVVLERIDTFLAVTDALRGSVLLVLLFAALVLATWKNLVTSLCIGLTGREWIAKATAVLVLGFLIAAGPLAYAFAKSDATQSFAWDYLPWLIAGLVCLKVAAAGWVAVRLHRHRVLRDRALVGAAAGWLAAVVAVYAFLEWLAGAPMFPFYFLGAIAVLAVPLTRLSATPLALALGRHR
jgi:hypothetical protein